MTPANPDNNKPFIYRIADALGVFHLVAPVNHTHSQAEIDGLADALAAKANTTDVNNALNNKSNSNHQHYYLSSSNGGKLGVYQNEGDEYIYIALFDNGTMYEYNLTPSDLSNVFDPDTTPTANSDRLVTSGGVKAALDNKTNLTQADIDSIVEVEVKHVGDDEYDQAKVIGRNRIVIGVGADAEDGSAIIDANNIANLQRALLDPDSSPTTNSTNLVTSGGVKAALNQKADTLAMNNALAGKAPLTDTQVLYMAIKEDGGRVSEIDVDALFTSGNTQVSLLIESLATSNVKLENVFTSAGRAFTFLTDLVEIPVGAVISCRIILSDAPSTDTQYFVVIDGIWVPQS